ncbi:MAG: L,D-transpeptidase [Lachnospiraceae bacterium]|nr:L,D-transpeptidase [Lachnospiraceae bacterium]
MAVLVFFLAVMIAIGYFYLRSQSNKNTFFSRTTLNGYVISGQSPEQVLTELVGKYSSPGVFLRENGETSISGTLKEFGYEIDQKALLESLNNLLNRQRTNVLVLIDSLMNGNAFNTDIPFRFDEKVFNNKVCAASLKEPRRSSVDAVMKFDDKKSEYYIVPETYGNEFNDRDLQQYVKEAVDELVSRSVPGINLELELPTEFYYLPAVTKDDINLNNTVNLLNQFSKTRVRYVFGDTKVELGWDEIQKWISVQDGEAVLNEVLIYEYVERLAANYDTRYYPRTFQTSIGTEVHIAGDFNTYGYTIDQDAEFSQLLMDIRSNTEIEREPIYITTTYDGYATPVYYKRNGRDDLYGTYVEVNLSMQHLWFYLEGSLVIESDFVSGCVVKGNETNTGVFPLAYKESPSVLSGQDGYNGYETKVNYWMPFSDGQGLHDAKWRSAFGGQIYITNGSHGCVNLPEYVAAVIYNNIQAGMAIVVYK